MSGGHNPNWAWKPSKIVRKNVSDGNRKAAEFRRATREQNAKKPAKG